MKEILKQINVTVASKSTLRRRRLRIGCLYWAQNITGTFLLSDDWWIFADNKQGHLAITI
jgi:hypothetical protein